MKSAIRHLPGVIETVVAMVTTILIIAAFDPTPGPLILGAVLTMTLSRSKLVDHWRGRVESVIGLPVVALLTAGVARFVDANDERSQSITSRLAPSIAVSYLRSAWLA